MKSYDFQVLIHALIEYQIEDNNNKTLSAQKWFLAIEPLKHQTELILLMKLTQQIKYLIKSNLSSYNSVRSMEVFTSIDN